MTTWNLFTTKKGSKKETYYTFKTKTSMVAWAAAHGGGVRKRSISNKYDYQFVR